MLVLVELVLLWKGCLDSCLLELELSVTFREQCVLYASSPWKEAKPNDKASCGPSDERRQRSWRLEAVSTVCRSGGGRRTMILYEGSEASVARLWSHRWA